MGLVLNIKLFHFVKYWMPAIVWMALIFIGSTDMLSAEHTSRFLAPFLRWLDPQITWATLNAVQTIIRKLGHVTEYAILAALLWRGGARRRCLEIEDVDPVCNCLDRLRHFRGKR